MELQLATRTAAQFPHLTLLWIFSMSVSPWVGKANKNVAPGASNRNLSKMEFPMRTSLPPVPGILSFLLAPDKCYSDTIMDVKSAL